MNFKNLVDALGRQFNFKKEKQTDDDARLVNLEKRYSTHPSSGLTPKRAAQLLLDAELGQLSAQSELAEDMEEKDTHLQSELSKRRRAVQSLDWLVKPPPNPTADEQYDADMLNEVIQNAEWFNDCLFDATDAILKGYSCQQLEWEESDGLMLPRSVEWQDPAHFQTAPNNRNELRLIDGSVEGVELQPFGWLTHIAKSKSGYLSRVGLVRTLVWPFIFKNYSVRDLAEFLEVYGLPIKIGRYPTGATDKEKRTLMQAIMSIGRNAGGIMPKSMEIDLKSAADGSAENHLAFARYMDLAMSKAILGGTLTSDQGETGSHALGTVHNGVRIEIRDSDALQLAPSLNRGLIYPIWMLNGKSVKNINRKPRIEPDIAQPGDMQAYATSLPSLVNMGMEIETNWLHDKLQIPRAAKGDTILQPMQPAMTPTAYLNARQGVGYAALSARNANAADAVPDITAALGAQMQNAIEPLLQPVIDAYLAGGYDHAKGLAGQLWPEMDDKQLTDNLHKAMFAVETWGRFNASR